MGSNQFGQLLRQLRTERRMSLRAFSARAGADPGNVSKIERGRLDPPPPETINQYAAALGFTEGSEEWQEFADLAATGRGQIPADIANDSELAARLPVFFRSYRKQRPTEEELEKMVEAIRKA